MKDADAGQARLLGSNRNSGVSRTSIPTWSLQEPQRRQSGWWDGNQLAHLRSPAPAAHTVAFGESAVFWL